MSPRPPMAPGTYGNISVFHEGPAKYRATVRYRERTGHTVKVVRYGQTKKAATDALKLELVNRSNLAGAGITSATRVTELAQTWLAEGAGGRWGESTREQYAYFVARYVEPTLGQLRIGEATTGVIDRAIARIRATNGPGAAKSAKAVLNGMFGLAVRHDAAVVNPVRDTARISRERTTTRALTVEEAADIMLLLEKDTRADEQLDLPDLVRFMLATGVRIGEACAVRESALDLEHGTVEINATVIRVKGEGLKIQERTKTAAGWRVLALPPSAVAMIERRLSGDRARFHHRSGVLFASPMRSGLRDRSNTAADLRERLSAYGGYDWVHFHTFRKTVATWLDAAGWTPRQIADQLGHARPSITQDTYMGRKVVNAEAAAVLDR